MRLPLTLTLTLGGYTDLPPGVIAAVTTYLDMSERPPPRPIVAAPGLSLTRLDPGAAGALRDYRDLYARIGRDLLWFSRAGLDDDTLAAVLGRSGVEVLLARRADGHSIGLVELATRQPETASGAETEIVYFGLVAEAIGAGTGRWLMERVLDHAFARPLSRLWLHTCHFDHPAALDFYRRSGFRPYKTAIELVSDPRLDGRLPRHAAPQIPLIAP